ncbi:hypothetical protein [Nonomuraea sp. NPDC050310]|uniref:hypothetical protein n=1 Tax=Nonomuraea sp. NPDC050310 TaxID=3154935 RepID=UPI0033E29F6C
MLAVAAASLTWITQRYATADVASLLDLLLTTEHTLGPHRAPSKTANGWGSLRHDDERRAAPEWETTMLQLAARLHANVEEILSLLDGHSLTLTREQTQARAFADTLRHLQHAITLVSTDQTDPDDEAPTLDALQRRQEREINTELRERARGRDHVAERHTDHDLAAAHWIVTRYRPNGRFEAVRVDDNDRHGDPHDGWAAVPAAVPALLRDWSVPACRPAKVTWRKNAIPYVPTRVLPYGGWTLDHDDDHDYGEEDRNSEHPETEELRQKRIAERRARFAGYVTRVRQAWPDHVSVTAFLEQRTTELNDACPPAPDLDELLEPTYYRSSPLGPAGGHLLGLGMMSTHEWIDPAAVANVGYRRWNAFGGHRPQTVPFMLDALRNRPVDEALKAWAFDDEPIKVIRIPGPAGPLYTLGENGAHRITAARLAGLPGIWARVEQHALALQVQPHQAAPHQEAARILACWRGLLERGLVTGRLEEDSHHLGLSTLQLDDAAAIWLLAGPRTAIAWAAAYERVYPGALAELGIASEYYADVRAWGAWLAGPV